MNTYYYNSYDYSPSQNSGFTSKSLEEGTVRRGELKPGLLYGSFRILECKPAWMGTSASMQGELAWQEMMPSETEGFLCVGPFMWTTEGTTADLTSEL